MNFSDLSSSSKLVKPAIRYAGKKRSRFNPRSAAHNFCSLEMFVYGFHPIQQKRYANDFENYELDLHFKKVKELLVKCNIAVED